MITSLIFDTEQIEEAVRYCKQQFTLSSKFGNSTIREQLENVWRQTGVKPKELDSLSELPKEFYYVWKVFIDLNQARTSNGFGYNPITYSEIDSYCRLMSLELTEDEVKMIRRFDREVLRIYNEEIEKNNSSKNKK